MEINGEKQRGAGRPFQMLKEVIAKEQRPYEE